jgi:formate-dependent phosphoribosylglycinamide formyltransferase (GAR transformylase)
VVAPAQIDGVIRDKAKAIAENVASVFPGVGIFGVLIIQDIIQLKLVIPLNLNSILDA